MASSTASGSSSWNGSSLGKSWSAFLRGWEPSSPASRMSRGLGPEAAVGRRGCACADPTCLELMSYDRMLPYIVDAIGWNVQLRDAILSTAAPPPDGDTASPEQPGGGTLSAAWHFDQEEEFEGITTDTTLPLL